SCAATGARTNGGNRNGTKCVVIVLTRVGKKPSSGLWAGPCPIRERPARLRAAVRGALPIATAQPGPRRPGDPPAQTVAETDADWREHPGPDHVGSGCISLRLRSVAPGTDKPHPYK